MGKSSVTKYFGLYCPQCNVWLKDSHNGFIYYPAAELVNALLTESDPANAGLREAHAWQAQEFGQEQPLNTDDPPAGVRLCPSIVEKLNQERYHQDMIERNRKRELTF